MAANVTAFQPVMTVWIDKRETVMNLHAAETLATSDEAACKRKPATFPLVLASEGERICIRAIGGAPSFVRRLMDLGLRTGGQARIVQHNAAGIVLAMDGMRLALGPAAAQHVTVSLCDACDAPVEAVRT